MQSLLRTNTKTSLYRSLHTTVACQMDRRAELKANIEAIQADVKKAAVGGKEVV